MVRVLSVIILIYRNTLSKLLGARCRFYPSCSVYAQQVLKKYGFVKGITKIIYRIIRCHPFNDGGYDPVK